MFSAETDTGTLAADAVVVVDDDDENEVVVEVEEEEDAGVGVVLGNFVMKNCLAFFTFSKYSEMKANQKDIYFKSNESIANLEFLLGLS